MMNSYKYIGSGAKIVGYKKEQKILDRIEFYAVTPKRLWIRYTCFWTDFSSWRVYFFFLLQNCNVYVRYIDSMGSEIPIVYIYNKIKKNKEM